MRHASGRAFARFKRLHGRQSAPVQTNAVPSTVETARHETPCASFKIRAVRLRSVSHGDIFLKSHFPPCYNIFYLIQFAPLEQSTVTLTVDTKRPRTGAQENEPITFERKHRKRQHTGNVCPVSFSTCCRSCHNGENEVADVNGMCCQVGRFNAHRCYMDKGRANGWRLHRRTAQTRTVCHGRGNGINGAKVAQGSVI